MSLPILARADDLHCWSRARPGLTLLRSTKGSLVVSPGWLAFATGGGNGVAGRMLWAAAGGIPGAVGVAVGVTDLVRTARGRWGQRRTDPEGVLPVGPGSWAAPMELVIVCQPVRRRFSLFLKVTVQAPGLDAVHFALTREQRFFPEADLFASLVADGRPAGGADG